MCMHLGTAVSYFEMLQKGLEIKSVKKAEAGCLVLKENLHWGSQTLVCITRGLWICHQGPREERGACGRWARG